MLGWGGGAGAGGEGAGSTLCAASCGELPPLPPPTTTIVGCCSCLPPKVLRRRRRERERRNQLLPARARAASQRACHHSRLLEHSFRSITADEVMNEGSSALQEPPLAAGLQAASCKRKQAGRRRPARVGTDVQAPVGGTFAAGALYVRAHQACRARASTFVTVRYPSHRSPSHRFVHLACCYLFRACAPPWKARPGAILGLFHCGRIRPGTPRPTDPSHVSQTRLQHCTHDLHGIPSSISALQPDDRSRP
jgi:hypothetical protein